MEIMPVYNFFVFLAMYVVSIVIGWWVTFHNNNLLTNSISIKGLRSIILKHTSYVLPMLLIAPPNKTSYILLIVLMLFSLTTPNIIIVVMLAPTRSIATIVIKGFTTLLIYEIAILYWIVYYNMMYFDIMRALPLFFVTLSLTMTTIFVGPYRVVSRYINHLGQYKQQIRE